MLLREQLDQAKAKPLAESQGSQDRVSMMFFRYQDYSADIAKTEFQQENEILKRENRLMATAFHDLSSRLQMSNVTLQRRSEPKSFLNRQRYAVDQATAVRSR